MITFHFFIHINPMLQFELILIKNFSFLNGTQPHKLGSSNILNIICIPILGQLNIIIDILFTLIINLTFLNHKSFILLFNIILNQIINFFNTQVLVLIQIIIFFHLFFNKVDPLEQFGIRIFQIFIEELRLIKILDFQADERENQNGCKNFNYKQQQVVLNVINHL